MNKFSVPSPTEAKALNVYRFLENVLLQYLKSLLSEVYQPQFEPSLNSFLVRTLRDCKSFLVRSCT